MSECQCWPSVGGAVADRYFPFRALHTHKFSVVKLAVVMFKPIRGGDFAGDPPSRSLAKELEGWLSS